MVSNSVGRALAGTIIGMAALMPLPASPAVVNGTVYHSLGNKQCNSATICVIDTFDAVPAAKMMLTRQVTCNFYVNAGDSIRALQVGQKAVSAVNILNYAYLNVPQQIAEDGSQVYYQFNQQVVVPVAKGSAPVVRFVFVASTTVVASCSVLGDLVTPTPT